jgi:hypothetical protein
MSILKCHDIVRILLSVTFHSGKYKALINEIIIKLTKIKHEAIVLYSGLFFYSV